VLQTGPWPSTLTTAYLSQVAERTSFNDSWVVGDPAPGWRYAYTTPSDMLRPRYLSTYAKFDRQAYSNGTAVMTNQDAALMFYTKRITDVSRWDNELFRAVVASLAAHMAVPLSGKLTLRDRLQNDALSIVAVANTDVANEQQFREEAMPEALAYRGYAEAPVLDVFIYPYQILNAVAA